MTSDDYVGDIPRNATHDLDLEHAARSTRKPLTRAQLAWVCGCLIGMACALCGYEIGRMSGKTEYYEIGQKDAERKIEKAITTHGTVVTSKGKYISVWHKITPQ